MEVHQGVRPEGSLQGWRKIICDETEMTNSQGNALRPAGSFLPVPSRRIYAPGFHFYGISLLTFGEMFGLKEEGPLAVHLRTLAHVLFDSRHEPAQVCLRTIIHSTADLSPELDILNPVC